MLDDRPRSRTEDIVVERINDELVVYDKLSQSGHCLTPDAASVWERCDGNLTTVEIADRVALAPEAVQRAIEALRECGLLDEDPVPADGAHASAHGYSRREAALKLAKAGGAAFAAPLIYSVAVGSPAAAQSSLGLPSCRTNPCTAVTAFGPTLLPVGSTLATNAFTYCAGVTSGCGSGRFVTTACCYGLGYCQQSLSSPPTFRCATQYGCVGAACCNRGTATNATAACPSGVTTCPWGGATNGGPSNVPCGGSGNNATNSTAQTYNCPCPTSGSLCPNTMMCSPGVGTPMGGPNFGCCGGWCGTNGSCTIPPASLLSSAASPQNAVPALNSLRQIDR